MPRNKQKTIFYKAFCYACLKFGGSSVGNPDRILSVINILKGYQKKKIEFIVVFSAFSGVTDSLISMARQLLGDPSYLSLWNTFHTRHIDAIHHLVKNKSANVSDHRLLKCRTSKNLLQGTFLVMEASPRTMDYVLSFGERASCMIITEAMNWTEHRIEFLDAREIIKTDKNFGVCIFDFNSTYKLIKSRYKSSKK